MSVAGRLVGPFPPRKSMLAQKGHSPGACRQPNKENEKETNNDAPPKTKKRHNNIVIKVWDTIDTIFTNQTGKFSY